MLKINLDDLVEYTGLKPHLAILALVEYARLVYKKEPKISYKNNKIIVESLILYSRNINLKELYDQLSKEKISREVLREYIRMYNIDVYLLRATFYNYLSEIEKSNAVCEKCKDRKR